MANTTHGYVLSELAVCDDGEQKERAMAVQLECGTVACGGVETQSVVFPSVLPLIRAQISPAPLSPFFLTIHHDELAQSTPSPPSPAVPTPSVPSSARFSAPVPLSECSSSGPQLRLISLPKPAQMDKNVPTLLTRIFPPPPSSPSSPRPLPPRLQQQRRPRPLTRPARPRRNIQRP